MLPLLFPTAKMVSEVNTASPIPTFPEQSWRTTSLAHSSRSPRFSLPVTSMSGANPSNNFSGSDSGVLGRNERQRVDACGLLQEITSLCNERRIGGSVKKNGVIDKGRKAVVRSLIDCGSTQPPTHSVSLSKCARLNGTLCRKSSDDRCTEVETRQERGGQR